MSHFYATIPVSARRTTSTACGRKSTGITTIAASYKGAIKVTLRYDDESGLDLFEVYHIPWQGVGTLKLIHSGTIGA